MEQTELEKKAEEYANNEINKMFVDEYEEVYVRASTLKQIIKNSHLKGLAEGKPKWHDLRKNPDDLPKEDCTEVMFVTKNGSETLTGKYRNGGGYGHPIFDTFGIAFYDFEDVIAWCELPKFEE